MVRNEQLIICKSQCCWQQILITFFVLIGTLGAGDIITPNGVVSGSESASKVASIGEYEKLESS